jgi:hypothetical protein
MRGILFFVSVLLVSCSGLNPVGLATDTVVPPASTIAPSPQAAARTVTAIPPAEKTSPVPQATLTSAQALRPTETASPARALVLQVKTPADESIVDTPVITVTGTTIPGAVVSVDGTLAAVDSKGEFQSAIALEEGPNVIEVVASDDSGNQVYSILTVIYQP